MINYSKHLRYTTAIAVSLIALSTSNQAHALCDSAGSAGDDTITCTGMTSDNLNFSTGTDVLNVGVGDSLDGGTNTPVSKGAGSLTITNDGTITFAADANFEATINSGADTLINNSGVISNTGGSGSFREAITINGATTSTINNSGTISSTSVVIDLNGGTTATINNLAGGMITTTGTNHSGIQLNGAVSNLDNAGTITGVLRAVELQGDGGTLTNQAGATITATGTGSSTGAVYVVEGGTANNIDNSGTISTTVAGAGIQSNGTGGTYLGTITNQIGGVIQGANHGISIRSSATWTGAITNHGTITGLSGDGLRVNCSTSCNTRITGGVTNTGTIQGTNYGVYVYQQPSSTSSGDSSINAITNSGTITGNTGIFVQNEAGPSTTGTASIGSITNSGTIEGTGGVAIDLRDVTSATALNINGGRIVGNVVDNNVINNFSPVTITGSGFDTEGDFTVSSLTVNAGEEFRISTGDTFSTETMTLGAGSTINFEVDAAGTVGNLNITGAVEGIDLTGAAIGAEVDAAAALSDGQEILIGQGATDVTGTTGVMGQTLLAAADDSLLWDFSIADGSQAEITGSMDSTELYFLVTQVASAGGSAITNNANTAGTVVNTLLGTTNPQLASIVSNVNAASTSEELEEILQAVLPQVDTGSLSAAQNVTNNTIRLVSDRLTTIRGGASSLSRGESGVSSGDITENLQAWAQVFGQKADQGTRKGIAGYEADTYGVTFGADTKGLHDNATLGVAIGYANTDVDSENATNTQSDINSYNLTVYGDYDLGNSSYIVGDIGYTYGDNETTRFNVGGVAGLNADSDYGSHQIQARAIIGRDYDLPNLGGLKVTPKAQARYTYFQNEDIDESGAGGANLNIESEALNILELGAGVDVRKDYLQNDGSVFKVEASAGYRYDLIGDAVATTSTFDAGGASFRSEGADPDQDTINLGLGVGYVTPSSVELTASYDYEYKDQFNSHSAFIRLAAPF